MWRGKRQLGLQYLYICSSPLFTGRVSNSRRLAKTLYISRGYEPGRTLLLRLAPGSCLIRSYNTLSQLRLLIFGMVHVQISFQGLEVTANKYCAWRRLYIEQPPAHPANRSYRTEQLSLKRVFPVCTRMSLPNIITDVGMPVIPLPFVYRLHPTRQVKIGLVLTFLIAGV